MRCGDRWSKRRTYPPLAVAFVNAEHRYVPAQVAVAVRRLLAYDNANGMRDAMCVCLLVVVNASVSNEVFNAGSYEE